MRVLKSKLFFIYTSHQQSCHLTVNDLPCFCFVDGALKILDRDNTKYWDTKIRCTPFVKKILCTCAKTAYIYIILYICTIKNALIEFIRHYDIMYLYGNATLFYDAIEIMVLRGWNLINNKNMDKNRHYLFS